MSTVGAIAALPPLTVSTRVSAALPVELRQVSYRIDGQVLIDSLDVTLSGGARTVVLGPNGAGKSLFLRLCHGLIRPSSGTLTWAGNKDPEAARRMQAMVFQKPVLLRRSVGANIAYALKHRAMSRDERAKRVGEALDMAGLTGLAQRPARVLSGGEQQRLALARAWATGPQVLFLDEPTASLDPTATRAVETLIGTINRAGVKIVMTTHDLGQAHRLADEILFMNKGRLVEQRPADRFFEHPQTAEAAAFIKGELLW
jgi:tungstate transport system ATP-binding protein